MGKIRAHKWANMWNRRIMNNKPDGVITELLPLAEGEELREFVQQQADADVSFAVKLSQWLTKQYGAFITESSAVIWADRVEISGQ